MYIFKFISSKAQNYPLNIIHIDQTLAVGETIKFLGLHVDSHLSQKSQVNVLLKKLCSACFMVIKLSYVLNTGTLKILCTLSIIINCGIIFCGSSKSTCNVFLIQRIII
jgi:hypothetical protein